jgi:aryl-alcohol dehydrogenase-like predicted oxidoreductase
MKMRYNRLGDSDLTVSEICLGTMTFGEQNTEAEAHAQLDLALGQGVNFIDVAEMYPVPPRAETQGLSERFVGSWLSRGARDRVILATKITGPGRGFGWIRGGELSIDQAAVSAAVDASLQRLRTDYIDLYQIHWPDRYVPSFGRIHYDPTGERGTVSILEQLEALDRVVRAGKVRYIGLSNETPWGVMQFLQLAQRHGLPRVASIQNAYSLLNRTYEAGLSEITRHERVSLLAYSPLAFGHLTGKYLGGAQPPGARLTRFPPFGQRYQKPMVESAVSEYARLASERGMSPATLALAFVRSRWFVGSTIIGATSLEQLRENLDATGQPLDDELIAAIETVHLHNSNPVV